MIAQNVVGSQIFEVVAPLVLQELRQACDGLAEARSGEALEQLTLEWSRKAGCRVLNAALQAQVEKLEAQADRRCGCAAGQQVHSRQPRTVLTLVGTVRLRRRYLRCAKCRQHHIPADEWLGWKGGFSRLLEEAVAWQAAAMPYRAALQGLRKFCGVELSLAGAQAIAARWGAAELKLPPYAERVAERLVMEIDGTMAHVEGAWHEIKMGAYVDWQQGRGGKTTYVADWLSAEQFAAPLWQEALVRGAPTARQIAVVADGAAWIWDLATTVLPRPVQILDRYHACEHLWQAGRVVAGDGTPETAALVARWKQDLLNGYSEGLEGELRELAATVRNPEEVLTKTANYLQTHQARLRYPLFRAAGWPIGSGVVEGGCKNVIGLRFKRKSARWNAPGMRAILNLRLDILNNRWEHRRDHLRLSV